MTNTQTQKQVSPESDRAYDEATDQSKVDGVELAHDALNAALERKALEPVLLDVSKLCSYTEYILILSGRSDRQVEAIAEGIKDSLRLRGRRALGVEGKASGQWALLDYGEVIIHVFHHPVREHYDLESLWNEAERVDIEVPDEARVRPEDRY